MDNRTSTVALIALLLSANVLAEDQIRDPFATLSNAPTVPKTSALVGLDHPQTARELELRAVLWGDHPLANISGMIVAEGDRVQDFTVEQLRRDAAVLHQAGKTILLVLDEDN